MEQSDWSGFTTMVQERNVHLSLTFTCICNIYIDM